MATGWDPKKVTEIAKKRAEVEHMSEGKTGEALL